MQIQNILYTFVVLRGNSEMDISEAQHIKNLEKELSAFKEQSASQNSMFEMTAVYLKKIQEDLKVSEQKLLQKNKNVTDSINYAKRIQDAFIVQINVLQKLFPSSFIFQKPKDIVSGDFVWEFENSSFIYLGVGDCTGHGVPGAMLSIFIISMLNQIVGSLDDETPASILEKLDKLILKYLSQYNDSVVDSAEISIIKFDKQKQKLSFSGAKRPLVHVRNNTVTIYNGAKYVLGNDERRNEIVENTEVHIQKNDMLYLFSDGFSDQFGGDGNRKYTTKKLIALLQGVSSLSVNQQYEKVHSAFENWKGENRQIDDVLLIGIQI